MKFRLALLLAALAMVGCAGDETPETDVPARDGVPVLSSLPPFALTDQDGAPYGSAELRDRVWIAGFIFTRCTGICPRITGSMKRVRTALDEGADADEFRLVSFSVDPDYDEPEVLTTYAGDYGIDATRWRFLTGSREEIWDLSKRGFKLPVAENPPEADELILHSPMLVLLDRAGRIRGYYDALDTEASAELVLDARRVAGEPLPVGIPAEIMDPPWLESRAAEQLAAAAGYDVDHAFRFNDRRPESGIGFRHRFVGDLGRDFKSTHYDHGNGVAVADVNGDGRLDLYFTTQLGANGLYENLGKGRFRDVTEEAGVGLPDRISVAPAFGDIDNDGDPDLFVTTVRGGNVLFLNDGKGVFRDITADAGVGHVGHSSGAVFVDYDRDGLLDLFVTNVGAYTTDELAPEGYYVSFKVSFDGHLKPERYETSILYRNVGGNRFEDVTEAVGLVEDGWNGDPHPADFNRDGRPDLYLINMQGHDAFWLNVDGKRFEKQPPDMFPADPFGSMGVSIFDFDNNGAMDVFIVDMHTDMFSSTMFTEYIPDMEHLKLPEDEKPSVRYLNTDGNHVLGNAFFLNDGNGSFKEVSDRIGAETYWPWGLSHGDLNADGWQDAFVVSSMNYPFRYQVNRVLLNDRGRRFVDAEFVLGVEPRRNRRTATPWFTLDCSGADLAHRDCEGRDGRIEVWGSLGSRSSVIFDLDGDGDLDVVTNDFGSEPLVLVSDLERQGPVGWLQVRLTGTTSNRSGIGARVTVHAGGRSFTRINDGKSGYLAQSDLPLYFGLGDADTVDSIAVMWPSGKTQKVSGPIPGGQTLEIVED